MPVHKNKTSLAEFECDLFAEMNRGLRRVQIGNRRLIFRLQDFSLCIELFPVDI